MADLTLMADSTPFVLPDALADAAIVASAPLTSARSIGVTRLTLQRPGAPPFTVVVKRFDPARAQPATVDRDHAYFREERLNYRFLELLEPRFPFAPRLLGETLNEFYLEDLGASGPVLSTPAMMDVTATAMAALHACSAGAEERYRDLREALGYPPPEHDPRLSLSASEARAFAVGASALTAWCAIIAPAHTAELRSAIDDAVVLTSAARPGHVFVHYDLVSARQCVLRDRQLLLVDFEHARFGERLIDLAKLMMGKLEVTDDDRLVHVHPSLPPQVADVYRGKWEVMQAEPTVDAAWRQELRAALAWQTATEVGRCLTLSQRLFVIGFAGTVRSFLQQLHDQLVVVAAEELRTAIGQLLKRLPSA